MAWSYYRSYMFSRRNGESWTWYLAQREMYKHTRLIYNPVPMIVDFYVDNIWRPAQNNDFESLVTPLRRRQMKRSSKPSHRSTSGQTFSRMRKRSNDMQRRQAMFLSRASTIAIGKKCFTGQSGQGLSKAARAERDGRRQLLHARV
jgi:hypothetical protein